MARLQRLPSGKFHISFRLGGRKYKRSLKTGDPRVAKSRKVRLEDTVRLVETGVVEIPAGIDVPTYLMSEGKKLDKTIVKDSRFGDLFDRFFDALPQGNLEESSIKTMKTHCRHLKRLLGAKTFASTLSMPMLQTYIQSRATEDGRCGRKISAVTIRKELTTFRSIWGWGIDAGLIADTPFPSKGLRYPKVAESPPFQTIEVLVAKTMSIDEHSTEARDLWSTVFLNQSEIEDLTHFAVTVRQRESTNGLSMPGWGTQLMKCGGDSRLELAPDGSYIAHVLGSSIDSAEHDLSEQINSPAVAGPGKLTYSVGCDFLGWETSYGSPRLAGADVSLKITDDGVAERLEGNEVCHVGLIAKIQKIDIQHENTDITGDVAINPGALFKVNLDLPAGNRNKAYVALERLRTIVRDRVGVDNPCAQFFPYR